MKKDTRILLLSIMFGLLFWLTDSLIDYTTVSGADFWGLLFTSVPAHEIYMRSAAFGFFVLFGIVLSILLRRPGYAEAIVEKGAENFTTALKSIGDGVIVTDNKGIVTFINPMAEQLTGWLSGEALGSPIEEVFNITNEFTNEKAKNPITRVLNEGVVVGLANHTQLTSRDGTVCPIDDSGAPVLNASGDIVGAVLVFRDISERRSAEKRISHLNSVLLAVRNVNQLITREKDPVKLIQESCNCLVETRGYDCAWIALTDDHGKVINVVYAGSNVGFKSLDRRMKEGDFPTCCRLAAQQLGVVTIKGPSEECPECPLVDHFPRSGTFVTQLHYDGHYYGFLAAYLPIHLVDDPEEKALFEEVAGDIAFALFAIEQQEIIQEAVRREKLVTDRLKLSIENMMDAYALHEAIFDENGRMKDYRFLQWNTAAEQITGRKSEEVIGRTALELFPGVAERGLLDRYADVVATGKPAYIEDFYYEGDNLNIAFDIACFRVDEKHFVCVFRNITDRKQIEEALARERERLAVTLSSIGDAVIATDTQGEIVLFNKMAERLTGYNEQEAIGRPLHEAFRIIDAETREELPNPVEKLVDSGRVSGFSRETLLISKNGTELVIDDSGAPIREPSGKIIGVVLVFRDVTETRRLRDMAMRAQRLETAGRIAGQVAHDFNNLLAPLMAYPEFIREALPEGDEARGFVDKIESAAEQIADINQQLLTLGRRGHYTVAPFSLNDTVREVVKQLSPVPSNLALDIELAEDLMPVRGGSAQVFRAVSNLVSNARDAMQDIGRLHIRTENFYLENMVGVHGPIPVGEYVKLTVTDTGPGLPDGMITRIFEPFFTTKTVDRRRGSGLGLSIVHAVMEDHNGYIDVKSWPGHGTSFFLYFPAVRDSVVGDQEDDDSIVGGNEKIVVVDDDPFQREVTITLLEKLGYEAVAVEGGEKAVDLLKSDSCDLLILDMIMPGGIDGAETYEQILAFHPGQKAVIVSGYAESERVQHAIGLGAGAFVRKPLTMKSLALAVRRELDRVTME